MERCVLRFGMGTVCLALWFRSPPLLNRPRLVLLLGQVLLHQWAEGDIQNPSVAGDALHDERPECPQHVNLWKQGVLSADSIAALGLKPPKI